MDSVEFSELLKELRVQRGLTITELAEKSGVSRPYLSQLESGKKNVPSVKVINDIANALEINNIELARMAGYYTGEDLGYRYIQEDPFNSMTDEQIGNHILAQNEKLLIEKYKQENYPQLEELLRNNTISLYFNKYELSKEDKLNVYKIFKGLFEGKEKTYPSDDDIRKEYLEYREALESAKNWNEELTEE